MFELVLFDLDGTLIDSLGDLAASMNEVLESMGHPPHPMPPYRRFVGDGVINLARRALPPEVEDEETLEEAVRRMREVYARRQLDTTKPFGGISELLGELSERGLKTAVLSNKPDGPTRDLVQTLLPDHSFDHVQGARKGVPLKPDPSSALELCSALGVRPQHVLYLGDTDTDMETARRAGMVAVGVTWGFRDEDELRDSGARHVVSHPSEVLELLA